MLVFECLVSGGRQERERSNINYVHYVAVLCSNVLTHSSDLTASVLYDILMFTQRPNRRYLIHRVYLMGLTAV
jgi:hypothetical protein